MLAKSLSVDANRFLKKVTPAGQRSRLAPFWNDITKLRQSGCIEQVCEFPRRQRGANVDCRPVEVHQTSRRRENKQPQNPHLVMTKRHASPLMTKPPAAPDAAGAETSPLTTRQRGEALADQYMKPASTNPALKRLNKEKK